MMQISLHSINQDYLFVANLSNQLTNLPDESEVLCSSFLHSEKTLDPCQGKDSLLLS